jgi:transposase
MVYKVPDAFLEEYIERIDELFHVKITKGQLSKFLAKEGLTLKKVRFSLMVTNKSFKSKHKNETQS